ncbi:MAG: FxDxF family PEP-CTERM protein [Rubrivivax sp.]
MRTFRWLARSLFLSLALYASQASAYFYIDDTTGSPTFNRSLDGFSGLSAVGTDVAYDSFSFSVDTTGTYSFRSLALPLADRWDNMLFLYGGSFDPGNATANGLISNDDYNGNIGLSGFDVSLSTGVVYVLVTTGFANTDLGRYATLIRGPGDITAPVPEPETYALLLCGLLVVGYLSRRRRND